MIHPIIVKREKSEGDSNNPGNYISCPENSCHGKMYRLIPKKFPMTYVKILTHLLEKLPCSVIKYHQDEIPYSQKNLQTSLTICYPAAKYHP